MPKLIPVHRASRYLLWFVVTTALVVGGTRWANYLAGAPSPATRWVGVMIGVAALIPWLVVIAIGVSATDEYERHVVLIGTAVAFGVLILTFTAIQSMRDAGLVTGQSRLPPLAIGAGVWALSIGATAAFYRSRR